MLLSLHQHMSQHLTTCFATLDHKFHGWPAISLNASWITPNLILMLQDFMILRKMLFLALLISASGSVKECLDSKSGGLWLQS